MYYSKITQGGKHMEMERRAFLSGLAGLSALPLTSKLSQAQGGTKPIVLGTFGGIFENALNGLAPSLRERAGLELQMSIGASALILTKVAASPQKSPFDAVMMTAETIRLGAAKGLFRTVTEKEIPNLAKVQPALLAPYKVDGGYLAAPTHWKAGGILWRKDLVPFEITSWYDIWRPELRNRVSIQNMPTLGGARMLITAAILHGGSQKDLEPGWKALKALRPNIREFYAITSNAITSLVAGDTWVSVNTLDLGLPLASKNVVATAPKEGVSVGVEGLAFPTTANDQDAAFKLAQFMLEDQSQLAWSKAAQVAPSTNVAVPADLQKNLVERPELLLKDSFNIDFLDMGMNLEAWASRWRRDVVG